MIWTISEILEGYFLDGCEPVIPLSNGTVDDCATSASCPSQDSELNSIYTRSAVCCNLGTLLFGYLMDRFGTWNSRLVACIMVTGGSGMLSIATPATSYFIKFGMYLLATGGIGFLGWVSIWTHCWSIKWSSDLYSKALYSNKHANWKIISSTKSSYHNNYQRLVWNIGSSSNDNQTHS